MSSILIFLSKDNFVQSSQRCSFMALHEKLLLNVTVSDLFVVKMQ